MFFKIILPVFDMPDCVGGGGVGVGAQYFELWFHNV